VRDGETLYNIAWRYGRDFKELARENKIAAPYLIQSGQIISLELSSAEAVRQASRQSRNVNRRSNVTKRKDSNNFRNDVTKL